MTATSTTTRKTAEANGESAVTPERFASGLNTYAAWMDSIELNKERFQRHYDEFEPNADDMARIKTLVDEHGVRALCLGEDWCPDVWRGVPVLAKVSEETGLEVRFFARDENKDLMAEFLKGGEFESIPTIVFYDGDWNYLGHWIERADQANEEMAPLREILAGKERGTPEFDAARDVYLSKTWEMAEGWRHAQVREMIALIEEALG